MDSLVDICIDTQFANRDGKLNPLGFAKKPWLYYAHQHATDAYLSSRFDKRELFLQHIAELNPEAYSSIRNKLNRIQIERQYFEGYKHKESLLKRLKESYRVWKKHVVEHCDEFQAEVEAGYTEGPIRYRHQDRYRALLQRVKEWDLTEQPIEEPTRIQTEEAPDFGLKAYAMYFTPKHDSGSGYVGHDHNHEWLSGHFPSQRIPANRLLKKDGDKNPLTNNEGNYLRYFHFPTNNMSWIEQAMARYYNEEDIMHDYGKSPTQMSHTEKLLGREYWQGQMYGLVHGYTGKVPIPAHHMRARCSLIPRSHKYQANERGRFPDSPNLLGSAQIATPRKNVALFLPYLHWETDSRRAKMAEAIKSATSSSHHYATRNRARSKKKEMSGIRETSLGAYLMSLAKVADAMDYVADEQFLEQNLHRDPPLHVRRTLNQYYSSTLEETSARDCDQVVSRETRAGRSSHGRTTRVVMVDQLWLWILDDSTIITSFPRRWGRNKPDPSGVHKCLRDQLKNDGEIRSIYHLALMIIDQCSRVFFDRIKPIDQRPDVINIFRLAIERVREHTAIAFDTFWRNTALQSSKWYTSHYTPHHKYLDVTLEGVLFQESNNLVEELTIMRQVFNQQFQVVKDFRRYLNLIKEDTYSNSIYIHGPLKSLATERLYREATSDRGTPPMDLGITPKFMQFLDGAVQEADTLLESIRSRQAEIQDLEELAIRTSQQLERQLSLKQQQASIVETKLGLLQADAHGRTIMALTLFTIFFLPLSFFTGLFGMNNKNSTGDEWMTLSQQVRYIFLLSALVVVIPVSIAFNQRVRVLMTLFFRIPLARIAEQSGLRWLWEEYIIDQASLQEKERKQLSELYRKKRRNDEERNKRRRERREDQDDGDDGRLSDRIILYRHPWRRQKMEENGSAPTV